MILTGKRTREWLAMTVAAGVMSLGQSWAQPPVGGGTPNLGGAVPPVGGGGVPNLGGQQGVPNLGGQQGVPNLNNPVNRGTQDIPNPGRIGNQVPSKAGNAVNNATQSARQFQTPEVGSADYGDNLPVRLQGSSIAGLDQNGSLGFNADTTTGGLKVKNVDTGSLAANAGLQGGDEIAAVNRSWVTSMQGFRESLASSLQSQGRAWVLVNRNGQEQWLNVNADGAARSAMGASYEVADGQLRLTNVFDGFAAADAGLRAGDRIVSINGQEISTRAEYLAAVRNHAGGELEIVVDRDGATDAITAQIPGLDDTKAFAWSAVRNSVSRMQSLTAELRETADDTAADRYEQLQEQVADLSNRVESTTDNTQEDTEERMEQFQESLQQISGRVNELRESAGESAADKLDALQERIASARSTLRDRLGDTSERAMTRASETTETVQDTVAARREALRDRTQALSDRIGQLAENSQDALGDRLNGVSERVASLRERTEQMVSGAEDDVMDEVGEAREETSEIRSELESLRAEAQTELQAELSAAVAESAAVSAALTAMAMAEVETRTEFIEETREDVNDSAENLVEAIEDGQDDTSEIVASLRDQALAEAQELRDNAQDLKADQFERIENLRERAAAIQTRLLLAAHEASGEARERLAAAAGRAGDLRDRLSDYAMAGRERVSDIRQAALNSGRERLQNAVSTLSDTVENVNGSAREQVESARETLSAVRSRIDDTREDVGDRRSELMSDLSDARSQLIEAARNAPEDVRSTLIEQIAKVETVVEDIARGYVIGDTSVSVSSRSNTSFGAQMQTAAGQLQVSTVQQGGLAAKMGLRDGDRILAVNGQSVSTEAELMNQMKVSAEAGQAAEVRIRRGDSEQTLRLNAGEYSVTSIQ